MEKKKDKKRKLFFRPGAFVASVQEYALVEVGPNESDAGSPAIIQPFTVCLTFIWKD